MTVLRWLAFLAAAGAGAVARYSIDAAIGRHARGLFPTGILTVNLLGSLALGMLVGAPGGDARGPVLFVAGTGFCGAFTTFSAFCYDTVALLEDGEIATAARNIALTAVGCVAAAGAGLALAT